MEFSNKVKDLLKKSGWKEGRKLSIEELDLPYEDYPAKIVSFLREFGNLQGDCEKITLSNSESINQFYLIPSIDESFLDDNEDYPYYQTIIGRKLYPIGAYNGDSYYICCDEHGRVYMIGEYCSYRGNSLHEGIENILLSNWKNSLQLDEESGKWWNREGEYTELPALKD
jgi:hypothetical protein